MSHRLINVKIIYSQTSPFIWPPHRPNRCIKWTCNGNQHFRFIQVFYDGSYLSLQFQRCPVLLFYNPGSEEKFQGFPLTLHPLKNLSASMRALTWGYNQLLSMSLHIQELGKNTEWAHGPTEPTVIQTWPITQFITWPPLWMLDQQHFGSLAISISSEPVSNNTQECGYF